MTDVAETAYLSRFFFPTLPDVAANCFPSGVKVVSGFAVIVGRAVAVFVAVFLVLAGSGNNVPQFAPTRFSLSPILNKTNRRYKAEGRSGHHQDR